MMTLKADGAIMEPGTERRVGLLFHDLRPGCAARWNVRMPGGGGRKRLAFILLTACVVFGCPWGGTPRALGGEDAVEDFLALRPDDYGILWKLSEMYENDGEMLDAGRKEQKIALFTPDTVSIYAMNRDACKGRDDRERFFWKDEYSCLQPEGRL